jgi:hypothetical protein
MNVARRLKEIAERDEKYPLVFPANSEELASPCESGLSLDSSVQLHGIDTANTCSDINEHPHSMQPQDAESPDSRCSDITTDDSDDEQDHAASLSDGIRNWAVHYGITLVALTALSTLLRVQHPFLPKDGRTLLKTRRSVIIDSRASGSFYHFGLLTNLLSVLDKMRCFLPDGSTINIQLNIDGLPLFKSSSLQFWPILEILKGFNIEPFVISLFCGHGKPSSLAEY